MSWSTPQSHYLLSPLSRLKATPARDDLGDLVRNLRGSDAGNLSMAPADKSRSVLDSVPFFSSGSSPSGGDDVVCLNVGSLGSTTHFEIEG